MPYKNTFIQVAEDCPITSSEIPTLRGKKKSIHLIQYELLTENPYTLTHKDLIFAVHVQRKGISAAELAENKAALWADLFQKEHPCLRASSLTKRYGWGAHYNEEGKIALFGMDSPEYQQFVQDEATKQLKAMRSKRK